MPLKNQVIKRVVHDEKPDVVKDRGDRPETPEENTQKMERRVDPRGYKVINEIKQVYIIINKNNNK
jgi:hypothetical protein